MRSAHEQKESHLSCLYEDVQIHTGDRAFMKQKS